MNLLFLFKAL